MDETIRIADLPQITFTYVDRGKHPQVTSSIGAAVDAGIAPLLEALWECGLETEWSCQGYPEQYQILPLHFATAYVVFPHRTHALRFQMYTADWLFSRGWTQEAMNVKLNPMTEQRASVTFPPLLMGEITTLWQEYQPG